MKRNFRLFQVGDEYIEFIVAETPEQALDHYNDRADDDCKVTIENVSEISLDKIAKFETVNGFLEMTFNEFLNYGGRFVYRQPQVVCWVE